MAILVTFSLTNIQHPLFLYSSNQLNIGERKMIYVYLGLFIVALWGVSLIALSRPGELSAVERCDLLSEFGGHLHWLEAIGHMPANELNVITLVRMLPDMKR
jgi:hypothetical protein